MNWMINKSVVKFLEAVLSDNMEGFMYIDSYEDSIHWGQIRYEIKNGTIQDIDEQFDAVSKCTAGKMYDAEQSWPFKLSQRLAGSYVEYIYRFYV